MLLLLLGAVKDVTSWHNLICSIIMSYWFSTPILQQPWFGLLHAWTHINISRSTGFFAQNSIALKEDEEIDKEEEDKEGEEEEEKGPVRNSGIEVNNRDYSLQSGLMHQNICSDITRMTTQVVPDFAPPKKNWQLFKNKTLLRESQNMGVRLKHPLCATETKRDCMTSIRKAATCWPIAPFTGQHSTTWRGLPGAFSSSRDQRTQKDNQLPVVLGAAL